MTFDPAKPEEGVYRDLPEQVYRAADAISQSQLKEFGEYATPLHYKARKLKVATPDMEFGTACHAAILQPERLHLAYHLRPDTYEAEVKGKTVRKPWHGGADACKAWLAEHSDRPIMTQEQLNKLPRIRERLLALPDFGAALKHGQTEVSFFKMDEETGLMLKARADVVAPAADGSTWLFDPKKVQSGEANERDFGKSCAGFGYDIQCASYLTITGASRFVFVPFDDESPFDACQYELDSESFNAGYREWRRLLLAYAKCLRENKWPGYPEKIRKLSLPDWVKRRDV